MRDGDVITKNLLTLEVNGIDITKAVCAETTLLGFLREELDLTGTKRGCDNGECGCCTVLLNEKPILSCLMLALEAQNQKITTIEGVGTINSPHPLQTAMVQEGAIQCGFCTPAMVINGIHLLNQPEKPKPDEIKECISGTICRCTGYTKIEKAFKRAAEELFDGK